MKNIRDFLTVMFRDITAQDVLSKEKGHTDFNNVDTPLVLILMEQRLSQYSRDDLGNMLLYLKETVSKSKMYSGKNVSKQTEGPLNVFHLLTYYVQQLLEVDGEEIKIKYDRLLHWKDLSFVLCEDVLVSCLLAHIDNRNGVTKDDNINRQFGWPKVLEHDNYELKMILKKGMADNHYHTKGSVPLFFDSWNYLLFEFKDELNHEPGQKWPKNLEDLPDINKLQAIEVATRHTTYRVSIGHNDIPLYNQLIQATLIRTYLLGVIRLDQGKKYSELMEETEGIFKDTTGKTRQSDNTRMKRNDSLLLTKLLDCRKISFEEEWSAEDPGESGRKKKSEEKRKTGNKFFHVENPPECVRIAHDRKNIEFSGSCGEREFLYQCFRRINGNAEARLTDGELKPFTHEQKTFFYAYLLIQNRFRVELVQINKDITGYANFSEIELRKDIFIPEKTGNINAKAIRDTLSNPYIRYLEARMSPRATKEAYEEYLGKIKAGFSNNPDDEQSWEKMSRRFRYIIHFVKQKDGGEYIWNDPKPDYLEEPVAGPILPDGKTSGNKTRLPSWYRQRKLREKIRSQADALIAYRSSEDEMRKMIIGIDACNSEIGCRPENFAPIFRRLRKEHPQDMKPLRITYHVGEDFLDIADGLRAIYEAIRFLNLKNGDRLGHALALGVDPQEWYQKKYRIFIPKQDYLDNVVWLYYTLVRYNIPGTDHLKTFLNNEFEHYFEQIYKPYITDEKIAEIVEAARKYYKEEENPVQNYLRTNMLNFDIYDYYRSWELRGDDPLCYRKGFFDHTEDFLKTYGHSYDVSYSFPEDFQVRFTPEPAILTYYYQFSAYVRRAGNEIARIKVKEEYIQAVQLIQKKMQDEIARMGIAIEANPTSNYLIGNFKHYDKHPIVGWYNHSLTNDPAELKECPQLNVSINTDDQGVFATRLDNEFALMALALEDLKDENGNPKYKRRDIYRWIDEIREMGINQNFIFQEEDTD